MRYHVSQCLPAIPDGRISRIRFWPWLGLICRNAGLPVFQPGLNVGPYTPAPANSLPPCSLSRPAPNPQFCAWFWPGSRKAAKCPEPLCPGRVRGWLAATWRGVTLSSSLLRAHAPVPNPPPPSAFARGAGLCRFMPIPAGSGTFPILSLQSFDGRLCPYPGKGPRCIRPFLPADLQPLLWRPKIGLSEISPTQLLRGGDDFGAAAILLYSGFHLCLALWLRLPSMGQPGRFHHAHLGPLPRQAVV